jgi:Coenzyme PQQ synthesis protein D (PqqD)
VTIEPDKLLDSQLRLPDHVVHRSFGSETVVLNLKTGKYHGLNPTAGRMLDVLADAPSVSEAATALADEYGEDRTEVETDLLEFCRDLLDRELMEAVVDASP